MRSLLAAALVLTASSVAAAQPAEGSLGARLLAASEAALLVVDEPRATAGAPGLAGQDVAAETPERHPVAPEAADLIDLDDDFLSSGLLTGGASLGVIVGAVLALATYSCTPQDGTVNLGGHCGPDGGYLAAGLGTLAVSAIVLAIGAAWLSVVDRRRAERDDALVVDVVVGERGGLAVLRGTF